MVSNGFKPQYSDTRFCQLAVVYEIFFEQPAVRIFQQPVGGRSLPVKKTKRWSRRVSETSNAMDLQKGVFALDSPRRVALSLKRSAERSRRRKTDPFRSAMSMLNFYINRAGRKLPKARRARLEVAKNELRGLYGRKAN